MQQQTSFTFNLIKNFITSLGVIWAVCYAVPSNVLLLNQTTSSH